MGPMYLLSDMWPLFASAVRPTFPMFQLRPHLQFHCQESYAVTTSDPTTNYSFCDLQVYTKYIYERLNASNFHF
jgi:hypothetical protein